MRCHIYILYVRRLRVTYFWMSQRQSQLAPQVPVHAWRREALQVDLSSEDRYIVCCGRNLNNTHTSRGSCIACYQNQLPLALVHSYGWARHPCSASHAQWPTPTWCNQCAYLVKGNIQVSFMLHS